MCSAGAVEYLVPNGIRTKNYATYTKNCLYLKVEFDVSQSWAQSYKYNFKCTLMLRQFEALWLAAQN